MHESFLELRRAEKDAKTNQGDFISYFLIFRQHWRRQQKKKSSLIEIQKLPFAYYFSVPSFAIVVLFLTAWLMLFTIEWNISISWFQLEEILALLLSNSSFPHFWCKVPDSRSTTREDRIQTLSLIVRWVPLRFVPMPICRIFFSSQGSRL